MQNYKKKATLSVLGVFACLAKKNFYKIFSWNSLLAANPALIFQPSLLCIVDHMPFSALLPLTVSIHHWMRFLAIFVLDVYLCWWLWSPLFLLPSIMTQSPLFVVIVSQIFTLFHRPWAPSSLFALFCRSCVPLCCLLSYIGSLYSPSLSMNLSMQRRYCVRWECSFQWIFFPQMVFANHIVC